MSEDAIMLTNRVPRHVEGRLREALADTRVVAVVGPRQSGKTTLTRRLAAIDGRAYFTLDDAQTRAFALEDPTGFVRELDRAAIDEVQRAPDLLLAIKQSVDLDPRPGRFLITGSADLFGGTRAPDSLAGRVETHELLPLSQAEIARLAPSTFLARCFAGQPLKATRAARPRSLGARVLAGGFPEALARRSGPRRRDWLRAYARALAERDVTELAGVDKHGQMAKLIAHLALANGQLLNLTDLGARVGVDAKTIDRWVALFEALYLVRRVRPWHRNGLSRLVKTPKLHFLDSGLVAALQGVDERLLSRDRKALGGLLECLVFTELSKAVALAEVSTTICHYRDKDQVEVDFVLEQSPGQVVGIEVKASATAHPDDFRGLLRLRDALGKDFKRGVVLHDGDRVMPFGDRLVAAPLSVLWS